MLLANREAQRDPPAVAVVAEKQNRDAHSRVKYQQQQ